MKPITIEQLGKITDKWIKELCEELNEVLEGTIKKAEEPEYYRCWEYGLCDFDFGLIYNVEDMNDVDKEIVHIYDFRPVRKPKEEEEYWWTDSLGNVETSMWEYVGDRQL